MSSNTTACVVNVPESIGAFFRDVVGIDLPSLGRRSEAALDTIVAWHEIGHAIHDTGHETAWTRRAAETWCDLLGCAAALASGHDPVCVSLYAEIRRLSCALDPSRTLSERIPLAEVRDRILRPVHYATADACDAMSELWRQAPWSSDLADLLAACDTVQEASLPHPRSVDAEALRALEAWHFRDRRCVLPINDHACVVDLRMVVSKGVDADELAREMAEHMDAKREIRVPRRDLPGGEVAYAAWTATQGARDAACPLVALLDELDARQGRHSPHL